MDDNWIRRGPFNVRIRDTIFTTFGREVLQELCLGIFNDLFTVLQGGYWPTLLKIVDLILQPGAKHLIAGPFL